MTKLHRGKIYVQLNCGVNRCPNFITDKSPSSSLIVFAHDLLEIGWSEVRLPGDTKWICPDTSKLHNKVREGGFK